MKEWLVEWQSIGQLIYEYKLAWANFRNVICIRLHPYKSMGMFLCTCTYIYMSAYMYVCIFICTNVCMHACMCVHEYISTCICIICLGMCTHTHIYIYIYIYSCLFLYPCICKTTCEIDKHKEANLQKPTQHRLQPSSTRLFVCFTCPQTHPPAILLPGLCSSLELRHNDAFEALADT